MAQRCIRDDYEMCRSRDTGATQSRPPTALDNGRTRNRGGVCAIFHKEALLDCPCRAAPVVASGQMYLRGPDSLVCLEVITDKKWRPRYNEAMRSGLQA